MKSKVKYWAGIAVAVLLITMVVALFIPEEEEDAPVDPEPTAEPEPTVEDTDNAGVPVEVYDCSEAPDTWVDRAFVYEDGTVRFVNEEGVDESFPGPLHEWVKMDCEQLR